VVTLGATLSLEKKHSGSNPLLLCVDGEIAEVGVTMRTHRCYEAGTDQKRRSAISCEVENSMYELSKEKEGNEEEGRGATPTVSRLFLFVCLFF
jgi:hypothetical protein